MGCEPSDGLPLLMQHLFYQTACVYHILYISLWPHTKTIFLLDFVYKKKTWGCPRLSHYQALALPPSRISNAVGPRREISCQLLQQGLFKLIQYTQRGRFPLRIFLMEIKFARFDSRRYVRKRPFLFIICLPTQPLWAN